MTSGMDLCIRITRSTFLRAGFFALGIFASLSGTLAAQLPIIRSHTVSAFASNFIGMPAGDIDGDGCDDYFGQSTGGAYELVYSGRTGTNILSITTAAVSAPAPFVVLPGNGGGSPYLINDCNLDGVRDYVLNNATTGQAYILSGAYLQAAARGLPLPGALVLHFVAATIWTDRCVASIGDLDGDGIGELVIGSALGSIQLSNAGDGISVFSGASGTMMWQVAAPSNYSNFGYVVRAMGDLNGDGYEDVATSSPFAFGSAATFHVYSGEYVAKTAAGLTPVTTQELLQLASPNNVDDEFGIDFDVLGDLNGDGKRDVLIGADHAPAGSLGPPNPPGEAFLFSGSAANPYLTLPGAQGGFGSRITALGDANGDGVDDYAVTAPLYTNTLNFQGRASIFSGVSNAPILHFYGTLANIALSRNMHEAGDINGDGFKDLFVDQNPLASGGQTNAWFITACGALRYGAPLAASPLNLSWVPGTVHPASGHIVISNASPFGAGVIAASSQSANTISGGLRVLINLSVPYLTATFGFSASGDWSYPANLNISGLNGASYFLEAVEASPVLRESNGLQIRFSD